MSGALKSKFQIGSIHGRMTYKAEERVFHPSDVPPQARVAREVVKETLKPKHLRKDKPPWDTGTAAGPSKSGMRACPWDDNGWDSRYYHAIEREYLIQKSHARLEAVRNGTFGEDPDAINPRWNVSTSPTPLVAQKMSLAKCSEGEMFLQQHRKKNLKLISSDYIPPAKRLECARAEQRAVKLRTNLAQSFDQVEDSLTSLVRSQSADGDRPYQRDSIAPTLNTFSSKSSSTMSSTIGANSLRPRGKVVRLYEHSGAWQYSQIEQQEVWSCCMSSDKNSRGCCSHVVAKPENWQLDSA